MKGKTTMLRSVNPAAGARPAGRPRSTAVGAILLTWRQVRAQALLALGLLALVAILAIITGPHLVHLYDVNVAPCKLPSDCSPVLNAFLLNDHFLQATLNTLVLVTPALTGIFWGAPLISRELETGTYRLVWTQSLTRRRWLVVKIGLVGLASMAVSGLISLTVTWWSSPFDRVNLNRFTPAMFGERGLTPIGYAAFAFAFGVAAGVLIRRAVPTMAATLAAIVAARLAIGYLVRPHLISPVKSITAFPAGGTGPTAAPGGWTLSQQTINAAGHVIGQDGGIGSNGGFGFRRNPDGTLLLQGVGTCPGKPDPLARFPQQGFLQACVNHFRLRNVLTYQPASRYWAFQWYETAIFLALALALAGFSIWWVRRHLT
jgi:ABC-type transport system involved in multi-copper enzyme maturation permease subunit